MAIQYGMYGGVRGGLNSLYSIKKLKANGGGIKWVKNNWKSGIGRQLVAGIPKAVYLSGIMTIYSGRCCVAWMKWEVPGEPRFQN